MQNEKDESYAFINGNDYQAEYTVCSAKAQVHETVKLSINIIVKWLKDMGYEEIQLGGNIEE
jgi:hypothetical protein